MPHTIGRAPEGRRAYQISVGAMAAVLSRPVSIFAVGLFLSIGVVGLQGGLRLGFDEGVWAYIAQLWVRRGIDPYLAAAEAKPPGIFYVYALSDWLFGVNCWFPRLVGLMATALAAWCVLQIGRQLKSESVGKIALGFFLLTSLWRQFDGAYLGETEVFQVPFVGFAMLLTLKACPTANRTAWRRFLVAGILLGLATGFKQTALFSMAGFTAWTIVISWGTVPSRVILTRVALAVITAIVVHFLLIIPHLFDGMTLFRYFKDVWLVLLQPNELAAGSGSRAARFLRVWIASPMVLLAPFILIFILKRGAGLGRRSFWALGLWFLAEWASANASGNIFGHQFRPLIMPFSLILATVLIHILNDEWFAQRLLTLAEKASASIWNVFAMVLLFTVPAPWFMTLPRACALGSLLAAGGLACFALARERHHRDRPRSTEIVRLDGATRALLILSLSVFWLVGEPVSTDVFRARWRMGPPRDVAKEIGVRIKAVSFPDDGLFVWDAETAICAHAGLMSPSRYDAVALLRPGVNEELKADLETHPAKFIVVGNRLNREHPAWFNDLLKQSYRIMDWNVPDHSVYQRR